jgi:hypothetical protein
MVARVMIVVVLIHPWSKAVLVLCQKITPRRSIRAFELLKYQTAGASGRLHTLPARNPRWRERRISLFEHRRQETQENAVIPQHSPGSDRRKSKESWGLFKN